MNRRQFLKNTAAAASSATITLLVTSFGCSSSGATVGSSTSTTQPCDGAGAESSVDDGHAHAICVPATDLESPPSGGATYTTTSDGSPSHTHQLALSQQDLALLGSGGSVTMKSSVGNGHSHTFVLERATAGATAVTKPT